jgi:mannan endo-1,4-beta-mannosidase
VSCILIRRVCAFASHGIAPAVLSFGLCLSACRAGPGAVVAPDEHAAQGPRLAPVRPPELPDAAASRPEAALPLARKTARNSGSVRAQLQRTLAELAASPRFALGQEDATAYGVGWAGDTDRSDVKSVCGAHVAVYGWDIFGVEKDAPANGDGVDFGHMRQLIQSAHRRGGINTISWHADNPVSGGSAWDKTRAVASILPGQKLHARYVAYLERVANYLHTLRGDSDELIPIIFRPFHEHTGSWFWWGGAHTTARGYVALWRFTVDYLRQERGLENLLFAFSPDGGQIHKDSDYLYRYPGDDYVDVFGVDQYYGNDPRHLVGVAEVVVRVAEAHGKIPALTEVGARGGLNAPGIRADWLLRSLLFPLKKSPVASRIAYALAWRNASPEHCFLPYPGQRGAAALQTFCADDQVVLEDDLARASQLTDAAAHVD